MPQPLTLSKPKQLLVEGRDSEAFFYPFVESIGLKDVVQIHDYGSITELAAFLKQFVRNAQFKKLPVRSIGIIRDAEQDATSAFQSICTALYKAELAVPEQPCLPTKHEPNVNIFILPDSETAGMIETLILRAVKDDPGFECVDRYLECVIQLTNSVPKPMDKARLLAYLASKPDIKPLTGFAARAGYLNLASQAYEPLRNFLLAI